MVRYKYKRMEGLKEVVAESVTMDHAGGGGGGGGGFFFFVWGGVVFFLSWVLGCMLSTL